LLLPDLRFASSIAPNGLGSTLDGSKSSVLPPSALNPNAVPVPANAFHTLATGDYVNWSLLLRLDVALGYRDAHAAVRSSRLSLAQSYLTLRDTERRYTQFLEQQYRAIFSTYAQIIAQRAQREAAAQQLEARNKQFQAGKGTLDFLLEAQRLWRTPFAPSTKPLPTITMRCPVRIRQGHDHAARQHRHRGRRLPQCAQIRAVEHERERSSAWC